MNNLKVLVLMHVDLVPPKKFDAKELETADWDTEYHVVKTLKELGHDVMELGVYGDLEVIRDALESYKPNIVFNLLEEFDGNINFDQHIVSYLELKKIPYTGCNPRGLTLARDKALCKKILTYHRIVTPKFFVFSKNHKINSKTKFPYPLIVKSLMADASEGIIQASVVNNLEALKERVKYIHQTIDTDAIAEQYINGRELYVGIFGNKRLKVLPIWELKMDNLPQTSRKFVTERIKWNDLYRKKYGIRAVKAASLTPTEIDLIQKVCKRTYQHLGLNGYARIDLRYTEEGKVYVIEANPNPAIAKGEEFPESAKVANMNYRDVIEKILALGLSWYQSRQ